MDKKIDVQKLFFEGKQNAKRPYYQYGKPYCACGKRLIKNIAGVRTSYCPFCGAMILWWEDEDVNEQR